MAIIPKNKRTILEKLIKEFWPGPLTLVLKRKKIVPNEVTAGLNTVAIRMPNNKIALKLIEKSKVPIAAPSANISGKPSGTCFKHVFEDFNNKIAGVIKSKPSKIGIESTVIDLSEKNYWILRPGKITLNELKKIIPKIKIYKYKNLKKKIKSPGIKYRHYSPNAKVILFKKNSYKKIEIYKKSLKKQNKKFFFINYKNNEKLSKKIFYIFRELDKKNVEYILVYLNDFSGIGYALKNRLEKAAYKII